MITQHKSRDKMLVAIVLLLILVCGFGYIAYKKIKVSDVKVKPDITYTNATDNNIQVDLPFPGAVVGKNFSAVGKARGNWFFEASFPIEVLDKDGKVLSTGIARAQSDWMTADFIPFKADIKIPDSYIGDATIVFKRDNPSGLPEHDASISFKITIEY